MLPLEKQPNFTPYAQRALAAYNVGHSTMKYIHHSDTVTFKVESPDAGQYLLRLPVPVTQVMGSHGTDPTMVNSELLWLEALNQDTLLVMQKPVRNREGNFVTAVLVDFSSAPVYCTLLHWLDDQPYVLELESPQTAAQIGEILVAKVPHIAQDFAA